MPLPSSGTITLGNLQTEFGGSNPIEISEYYRGGNRVPNITVNNAVPTSGQISLSNFYGTQAADPNPATFDLNGISISGTNSAVGNTNTVTITGINVPITLNFGTTTKYEYSSQYIYNPGGGSGTLEIYVNGSTLANTMYFSAIGGSGSGGITDNVTVTVSNNDTIIVYLSVSVEGVVGDGFSCGADFTITNTSSANAVLDTFSVTGYVTVS